MSEISKEAAMVRDALLAQGLETPRIPVDMSHDEQRAEIEKHMGAIMDILGLDRSDDSLNRTPYRIAKMYVNEIFSGLDYANFPSITVIDNKMKVDEMVKVSDITLSPADFLYGIEFRFPDQAANLLTEIDCVYVKYH